MLIHLLNLNIYIIKLIYILSASKCGFPFGFPCCAIHIKRGYKDETKIMVYGGNNEQNKVI